MRGRLILLLIITTALTGCGKSEKAIQELARLNVDYSESSFIESSRQGNAEAVKLFLDAGMNTEVKTRDGQTPRCNRACTRTNQMQTMESIPRLHLLA